MADEWQSQLKQFVNTTDRLKNFINLTQEEEEVLSTTQTTWGTTPYFASLMDRDDPRCLAWSHDRSYPADACRCHQHRQDSTDAGLLH